MLTSFIRQCCFSSYKFPNAFSSLANSFYIAMCHLVWLLSRKYGTVWYHPASSKLWYLTALSFVNFQEKLTGTSPLLSARVKPACSACCVFGARCAFRVNTGHRGPVLRREPDLVLSAKRGFTESCRFGSRRSFQLSVKTLFPVVRNIFAVI
jgi:hypothetical protein